jgi:hypothetical protein
MNIDKLIEKSPISLISHNQKFNLGNGELGCVFADTGCGKSAFLIHAGLDNLLRGINVLHVSLGDSQLHIRGHYDTLYSELLKGSLQPESPYARASIERHRLVHSCLGRDFHFDDLRKILNDFSNLLDFHPAIVIIDDVNLPKTSAEGWKTLSQEHGFRLWLSSKISDKPENLTAFDTIVELSSGNDSVHMQITKRDGKLLKNETHLLSSVTMLLKNEQRVSNDATPLKAKQCTLFSGGAMGSESFFGEISEEFNLNEVNFTFEGHNQKRTRGSTLLSERELASGSVSLAYVSKRLHRHWDRTPLLRKVLQVLWHVVSHADQVFIVGIIQQDDTVHGGTGWSVELARRWKKPVWVYDQEREDWFHWTGDAWDKEVPTITSPNIAGSGTRFLNEASKKAIRELFERSFN